MPTKQVGLVKAGEVKKQKTAPGLELFWVLVGPVGIEPTAKRL
jgi:hypothetical protein